MKSVVLICVLMLVCLCGAQQKATAPKQQDNGFMSWIHDAWKTVQDQGKPAAEKLVRQFPKRFQDMKQQVATMSKRVHDKVVQFDVEQKRTMVIELWRMRKSLDLLTLLRPEVLQSLTGLDTSGLAALEDQVKGLMNLVQGQTKHQTT
jgi:hypothetical protein